MTAVSRRAILDAHAIEIFETQGSYLIKASSKCGYRVCFVHGGDGYLLLYPTFGAAERAIHRLRPDVSPRFSNLSQTSF
jgi:hypothetical protein